MDVKLIDADVKKVRLIDIEPGEFCLYMNPCSGKRRADVLLRVTPYDGIHAVNITDTRLFYTNGLDLVIPLVQLKPLELQKKG